MADIYNTVDSAGREKVVEFTVVSAGAANSGEGVALGSNGKLDKSVLPTPDSPDSYTAGEAITANSTVSIVEEGTGNNITRKIYAADSDAGRPAHAFIIAAVAADATVNIHRAGKLSGQTLPSGVKVGEAAFQSATPGKAGKGIDLTSSTNRITTRFLQYIGTWFSTTEVAFEQGQSRWGATA